MARSNSGTFYSRPFYFVLSPNGTKVRFSIAAAAIRLGPDRIVSPDMTNPHFHVVRLGTTHPLVLSAPLKRAIWAALIRRAMSDMGNYGKVSLKAEVLASQTLRRGRQIL